MSNLQNCEINYVLFKAISLWWSFVTAAIGNKKRVYKVFIAEKTLDTDLIDSQDFVTWIKWEDI